MAKSAGCQVRFRAAAPKPTPEVIATRRVIRGLVASTIDARRPGTGPTRGVAEAVVAAGAVWLTYGILGRSNKSCLTGKHCTPETTPSRVIRRVSRGGPKARKPSDDAYWWRPYERPVFQSAEPRAAAD